MNDEMTGFTNSSLISSININKTIEQYYTYFSLLNKSFENYKIYNDKEIYELKNKLDEYDKFLDWYISASLWKKLIWKIKKLNYKQLNKIRKNGI